MVCSYAFNTKKYLVNKLLYPGRSIDSHSHEAYHIKNEIEKTIYKNLIVSLITLVDKRNVKENPNSTALFPIL